MKPARQVVLHMLCVFVGFWWITAEVPQAVNIAKPASGPMQWPPAQTKAPVASFQGKATLEQRLAELTPDNWANELRSIAKLGLAELPSALRGALSARFPIVRRRLVSELFKRWAALDRAGALAALQSMTSPQMKATALNAVLTHWVEGDEQRAWQWVVALDGDSVLQENGIEALLTICAGKHPRLYASWAEELEEPFLRCKALNQIAQAWARTDPQGALAAALVTTNEVLRTELLERISCQDNLGIARAEVMDSILRLPDRAERARTLSQNWMSGFAKENAEEALQWLIARSADPDLQKAAGTLGEVLAAQARRLTDIQHQILQIPEGPARDAFAAKAAAAWATNAARAREARVLLELCGPCIERQYALEQIQEVSAATQ